VNARGHYSKHNGFALILTLSLLALLVLVVMSMASLSKVEAQTGAIAVAQTQARQNALLALGVALGELQRHAGEDGRITAMAGVTGVGAGANRPTRHWCGVWSATGVFQTWLVSGAGGSAVPSIEGAEQVAILAGGALGADGTDKEHVWVGKLPVEVTAPDGVLIRSGSYAYWVGDEGVKLSAVTNDGDRVVPGLAHAVDELIISLDPAASSLPQVQSYAQLAFVPATPLTPGPLQSHLHSLTVTHRRLLPAGLAVEPRVGAINVNTTVARVWRGVAATYERARPTQPLGITTTTFANRIRDNLPLHAGAGKNPLGPFLSADAFRSSGLLEAALAGSGVSRLDFVEAVGGLFTERSDTFRLRAYGEALNPVTAEITARAQCEAIVQRVESVIPGHGRRFVITSFRWLGPGDL